MNAITSYLDGSNIYGSDTNRSVQLRTLSGGRLNVSAFNLLPFQSNGVVRMAGDVRAHEMPALLCIHTLFVRY